MSEILEDIKLDEQHQYILLKMPLIGTTNANDILYKMSRDHRKSFAFGFEALTYLMRCNLIEGPESNCCLTDAGIEEYKKIKP